MGKYIKYKLDYKNLYNVACKVEVIGNYEGANAPSTITLTGAASPFIIATDSDNFLYKPTKFSGATLRLVGKDYLQDLYSSNYQEHKVNYYENNVLKWTGYITPEIYTQDYNSELFELELECVSALATTKNIEYSTEAPKESLFTLLQKAIKAANGDYKNVYIPNVYKEDLNTLYVLTSNFFNEDGVAMKYSEIIEEVCKFLNWVCFEYDANIYFVDYEYIKAKQTKYTRYTNQLTTPTQVSLDYSGVVQSIGFTSSDNTLSIVNSYNKVSVVASDYESNVAIPEFDDEKTTFQSDVTAVTTVNKVEVEYYNRYFETSKFHVPKYNYVNGKWVEVEGSLGMNYNFQTGAVFTRCTSYPKDDKPMKLTFENTIKVNRYNSNGIKLDHSLATFNTKSNTSYIPFVDSYLGIYFEFKCLQAGTGLHSTHKFDTNNTDLFFAKKGDFDFYAKVRIGQYYYNGTEWTTTDSKFKLEIEVNETTKPFRFNDWIKVEDRNVFDNHTPDLKGFIIKPAPFMIEGDLEVTLYNIKQNGYRYHSVSDQEAQAIDHLHYFTYLKNIEVKIQKPDINNVYGDYREKTDTLYSAKPNTKFISEADDIIFNITSQNDSDFSLSKVFDSKGYVDKLTLYNGKTVKPEEYIIDRVTTQYANSKIKTLQCIRNKVNPLMLLTDTYLGNKKFMMIGYEADSANDSINCEMIEIN